MENETNTAPVEETKVEETSAPVAEAKADVKENVEVPAKFKKIVEEIEGMSVLDLNELVGIFEKKFGVSATAVAASAGPAAGAEDAGGGLVNLELSDAGANKISVIKVVKEVLGLGLKEAKDLVDAAPAMVKTDMKKEEAEELKKKIEEAGGKVSFK